MAALAVVRRRPAWVPAVVAATFVIAGALSEPVVVASGACAGHEITLSPGTASSGDMVTVTGTGWATCDDTDRDDDCSVPQPARDIRVTLTSSGRMFDLAHGDADDAGSFSVDIRIPQDAGGGPARIAAGSEGWSPTAKPIRITEGAQSDGVTAAEPPASFAGADPAAQSWFQRNVACNLVPLVAVSLSILISAVILRGWWRTRREDDEFE